MRKRGIRREGVEDKGTGIRKGEGVWIRKGEGVWIRKGEGVWIRERGRGCG